MELGLGSASRFAAVKVENTTTEFGFTGVERMAMPNCA